MRKLTLTLTDEDVREIGFCVSTMANELKAEMKDPHITDLSKQRKKELFTRLKCTYDSIQKQYEEQMKDLLIID